MESFCHANAMSHPTKDGIVILAATCPFCGKEHTTEVNEQDWKHGKLLYIGGALMQNAFPTFTPSQREMLITGICDKCWEKM